MGQRTRETAAERPGGPPAHEAPAVDLFFPPEVDDLSTHRERQAIGYLGLFLSPSLWIISALRPTASQPPWTPWISVSSYYYSGGGAVLAGVLAVLAVFLFTYRGYDNNHNGWDRFAGRLAGAAALGVAAFPTWAPCPLSAPSWWTPTTMRVHDVSAAVLFGSFAFFSAVLFRKSSVPKERRSSGAKWRKRLYLGCGIAILACMAWAGLAGHAGRSIFWPETLALVSFAFSWLAKGRAGWTLARIPAWTARKVASIATGGWHLAARRP